MSKTGAAINVPVSEAEHMQYELIAAPPLDASSNGAMIEMPVDLAAFLYCILHSQIGVLRKMLSHLFPVKHLRIIEL